MAHEEGLKQVLIDQKRLSEAAWGKAVALQEKSGGPMAEALIKLGLVSPDDINAAYAQQFGVPTLSEVPNITLAKEKFKEVSYSFVKKHLALPVKEEENYILCAIFDPLNLDALDDLSLILKQPVRPVQVPKAALTAAINQCYRQEAGAASQLISNMQKGGDESTDDEVDSYDLLDDRPGQPPIVKLLNLILSEAINQGASDIHFEPSETDFRVRYRIDGVLQNRHAPGPEYIAQLVTRVKVMAGMDIAERRLPQDGRIKLRMGGREVDFRVSTVPVVHGERIVLRILDKGNVVLGLESMNMLKGPFEQYKSLIRMPEGILLVTGPTGSGKTTTLYSTISELVTDEVNIMTIEDPVEYKLPGIAQIGVRPKIELDFAKGLRHILRQDPDVIMVGEIRDLETAEIAIQASLTGHFVLSTLHTNDAPSAITRLADMGIESYLLASSIVGIIAQRLVRRICPHCIEAYTPMEKELASIGLLAKDLDNGVLYRGKGCRKCFGTGYKGRQGIYELLRVTDDLRAQIAKSQDARVLRKAALDGGMITLKDHGALLVKSGLTTVPEVLRVTRA